MDFTPPDAFSDPGTARHEAERLVAAVLALAAVAANANPHLSTGSAECCLCPFCKVIAAVRDPDPDFVERLATGAGDLAAGVASFLRHVSSADSAHGSWTAAADQRAAADQGMSSGEPAVPTPRAASEESAPAAEPAEAVKKVAKDGGQPPAAKKVAKKAVKRAVKKVVKDGGQPPAAPPENA